MSLGPLLPSHFGDATAPLTYVVNLLSKTRYCHLSTLRKREEKSAVVSAVLTTNDTAKSFHSTPVHLKVYS